jgi:hypothetical protein
LRKCVQCGALNNDSDASCGVCGGGLRSHSEEALQSDQTRSQARVGTRPQVHPRGLIGLIVGLFLLVFGLMLLGSSAALLGFFLLFIGVVSIGTVIGMFKGLPYQPNSGWHATGDPDLAATATRGAKPSHVQMSEVDRELESKERKEESD